MTIFRQNDSNGTVDKNKAALARPILRDGIA